MPVPKRKRSRARRDSRHAHKALTIKAIVLCKQCDQPLPTHQACSECGYYKGVKVLRTKSDRSQQRGEIRKAKEATQKKQDESKDSSGVERS